MPPPRKEVCWLRSSCWSRPSPREMIRQTPATRRRSIPSAMPWRTAVRWMGARWCCTPGPSTGPCPSRTLSGATAWPGCSSTTSASALRASSLPGSRSASLSPSSASSPPPRLENCPRRCSRTTLPWCAPAALPAPALTCSTLTAIPCSGRLAHSSSPSTSPPSLLSSSRMAPPSSPSPSFLPSALSPSPPSTCSTGLSASSLPPSSSRLSPSLSAARLPRLLLLLTRPSFH